DKTSNDFAPLADVVDEVLEYYKNEGKTFDCFCCILATAPFIKAEDLIQANARLTKTNFDTIRPVVRFDYPIQRAFKMSEEQEVSFFYPQYVNSRSQDLEPAYHDAGLFYFGRCSKGLHDDNKKGGIVISPERCQDIDDENDWRIAEFKYRLINENE
ncbi:MAG: pseudaminic acid cytidylyltransferase, partial [Odoribacter sp.]|nr:pseudaminic acid cytidylyltransferase [Odoribacter sp.]